MNDTKNIFFRRKFSINPYKRLRIPLGEMSLYTDWTVSKRGDPYPLVSKSGEISERVALTEYGASGDGSLSRLLGQHFPYATYALRLGELNGSLGFSFICDGNGGGEYTPDNAPRAYIYLNSEENGVFVRCDAYIGASDTPTSSFSAPITGGAEAGNVFSVTCRGDFFDIYLDRGNMPEFICTFELPELAEIRKLINFRACSANLFVSLKNDGCVTARDICWYLEGGVAHADIRPIRYEDGTPMMEGGRLFMTMSSRLAAGGFQSVISWDPYGCDLRLEGALFFDAGDGAWCGDVASSVLYNRMTNEFMLWMCSFSHGHILAHGVSKADLRHGIHVIDVTLMPVEAYRESAEEDGTDPGGAKKRGNAIISDDRSFAGKHGDEDPDFYYDAELGKWFLTVCRHSTQSNGGSGYEYFRFVSDRPFDGYTFIARTDGAQETGGSTVRIGEERYFFCGSRFDARARYNAYRIEKGEQGGFEPIGNILCDFDDGGFRGWGTVIPVPCGNRMKYMWMTFDRHLGSPTYNWSYGNLYVYESDLFPTLS